jgi:carboxyl-terminal processing protease
MAVYRRTFLASLILICSVTSQASERKEGRTQQESFANWSNRPKEPFLKGQENFERVKSELMKNYYDKNLSEDELYRAAVQGMLNRIDPKMSEWNTLYYPSELGELTTDMEGEISGVGIQTGYNNVTGYSFVHGTIPGSPAAKAGIKKGDEILRVDGKSFRNLELRDLVYAIRGKTGTTVTLTILHDETIKEFKLKRDKIKLESVTLTMHEGGIGQLVVGPFTSRSAAALKDVAATFKDKGVKALVIDLRGNDGGLFESSLDVIRLFVPKGKTIVKMIKRDNVKEDILGTDDPLIKNLPLVVLIDGQTKSGGEIMAAALAMSAGATTVGENSFGKWSAQRLEELPNKFAIKYTVATFRPPSGEDLTGKGLKPNIHVSGREESNASPKGVLKNPRQAEPTMNSDIQLEAAIQVLRLSKK